jgi:cysteine desulfuration protein SufE
MPDNTQQTVAEKQHAVVEEFAAIDDWQDRYRRIIDMGKKLPAFPEEYRNEDHKVKGCQSQVWLHADLADGAVQFQADSDAAIVRGLIALLLEVYSGRAPQEIVASKDTFLDEMGLMENLSQTRSNGLSAMLKQMKYYAVAYSALAGRSE